MTATARALTILGRFPRHLEVDDDRKLFAAVVDALATPLDVQTSQLGRVRRARRVEHADEHTDLLKLAALHRLRESDFELLTVRLAAIGAALDLVATDAAAALARLPSLLAIAANSFANATAAAAALGDLVAYESEVESLRQRIRGTIEAHRAGNGTVGALLAGTANALDLDVIRIRHSFDRFWHEARCLERMRAGDAAPVEDLVFLEENPLRDSSLRPVERRHAEKFLVRRAGFEAVPTGVIVTGIADRTVFPMVVQRDTGVGVAFVGDVPDGEELRFELDGTVTLDGADVTRMAYAFSGGVFTDEPSTPGGPPHPGDFLFGSEGTPPGPRTARYATTAPVNGAFDPAFTWPRSAGALPLPTLAVGETRWAFFVRVAHFGAVLVPPTPVPAAPLTLAGIFDQSVWAWDADPTEASARVGFAWREREPFAVKVWLPRRHGELEVEGTLSVRERVRSILDRHRAAGVHVYVTVTQELRTVGGGFLPRDASSIDVIPEGTVVWPDETTIRRRIALPEE